MTTPLTDFPILDYDQCSNYRQRPIEEEIQEPIRPGTFQMAKSLVRNQCYAVISKEYSIPEWLEFANNNKDLMPKIMISTDDFDYLRSILRAVTEIKHICLVPDKVYFQNFQDFVSKVRRNFPTHAITVGGNFSLGEDIANVPKTFTRRPAKVVRVEVPVTANATQIPSKVVKFNKQPGVSSFSISKKTFI